MQSPRGDLHKNVRLFFAPFSSSSQVTCSTLINQIPVLCVVFRILCLFHAIIGQLAVIAMQTESLYGH